MSNVIPWAYPTIQKFYLSTKLNYKKIYFKFTKDRKMINKNFYLRKIHLLHTQEALLIIMCTQFIRVITKKL